MNCTWGGPDELPMKINNPKKQNMKGLVFNKKKPKKLSIKKKAKKIVKKRRRS
jgi:hypothetical protein